VDGDQGSQGVGWGWGVTLRATCLTRDQANDYVELHHRHHGRVSGHRFIVGAMQGTTLVGIAIAGRPRARLIEQYTNVEVSRLCTAGERNACSFLYSRVARVVRELGFATCFTAILESETGGSLRAAGWQYAYTTAGGSQDRPSRRRVDRSPTTPKAIWCPAWCRDSVLALNKEASDRAHEAELVAFADRCLP
jgi:hypothetical protein